MNIFYNSFPEHKFLFFKFIGDWDMETYRNSIHKVRNLISKDNIEKIIVDMRALNALDIHTFDEELKNIRLYDLVAHTRNVYIVDSPKVTASAYLYTTSLNKYGLNYDYCSTIEKAIDILQLSFHPNLLNNSLIELID